MNYIVAATLAIVSYKLARYWEKEDGFGWLSLFKSAGAYIGAITAGTFAVYIAVKGI